MDERNVARHDRGDTLIEVLAAVTVLSLTSAALFTALATTSRIAGRERSQVLVDAAVRGGAEALIAAGRRCVPGQPLVVEPGVVNDVVTVTVTDLDGEHPTCPETGAALEVEMTVVAADGTTSRAEMVLRVEPEAMT